MDCWKKFWKTPTIHDDSRFHGTSDSLHVGLVTLRFYSQARKGVKVVGPSVVDRTVRTAWMYKNVMIDGYRNDDMMIWMDIVWNQAISSTLHCLHNEHGAYWSCFVEVEKAAWKCPVDLVFLRMSCHQRFLRLREKFHIGDVQQSWAHSAGRIFRWSDPGGSALSGAWSERMQQVRFDSRWTSNVLYLRVDVFDLFHVYLKLSNCDLWCDSWSPVVQNSWLQLFSLSKLMRFWLRPTALSVELMA